MFIVHTMEEIQGLLEAHSQFKATLGEADKEYTSIVGLVKEVEATVHKYHIPGGLENPYTTLTANVWLKYILHIIFSLAALIFYSLNCRILPENGLK